MKALLIRWGRRWIAGLLVIAMLSGTVPAAFAAEVGQGVTESGTVSGTESGENAVPDEVLLSEESDLGQAPSSDTDNVTDTGGSSDTDASSDTDTSSNTDTSTGTDSSTDTAPEGDNTGLQEETLLQDEELLLEDDLVSEQSIAMLTDDEGLAAVAADDAYSISTLGDAAQIAQSLVEEGNVAPLKVNGTEISINQSAGLVLLSNVNPKEYSSYTINLTMLDAGINYFDLVTAVEIKDTEGKVTAYPFRGLGGTGTPFAGQIVFAQESNKPIQLSRALFRALSTQASFLEYISTNTPKSATLTFDVSKGVSGPVLAEEVSAGNEADWSIILSGSAAIGGIIGTISSGTVNLTATVADGVALTCSSSPNAGFFCNTLLGGSLNATLSGSGSITVTATSGDAGGFVGRMEANTALTANADGITITQVTATSGNAGGIVGKMGEGTTLKVKTVPTRSVSATNNGAGGLVGKAENAKIEPIPANEGSTGTDVINVSNVNVSGTGQSAVVGGLIGQYTTSGGSINLDSYAFSNITVSASGGFGGGVFGKLINSDGELTISGANTVSSIGSNVYSFGGLIGTYSASVLADTLTIKGLTVNSTIGNGNNGYGGVIGKLMDTCYVRMDSLTANISGTCGILGGLVARVGETRAVLLDVGTVAVTVTGTVTSGDNRGGLVGYLQRGVVRLNGTTDIGVSISADTYKGNIVGQNGDGLVYATSAWTTTTNTSSASNIGNWGEVVRLGGKLSAENANEGLFLFSNTDHTITVQTSLFGSITDADDFAGYALAFNYGNTLSPVLTFTNSIDASQSQTVTLTNNIDLSNTGILGIGRDNGSGTAFQGTFDGGGKTITLDIGNQAGTLHANGSAHCRLGLFASVGDAMIQNVTVKGNVKVTSELLGSGSFSAAGVVAMQSGNVTYSGVTASALVSVLKNANNGTVMQAGMVAQCAAGTTTEFTNCPWTSALTSNRTNGNDCMGGFLAYTPGGVAITVNGCELSGKITSSSESNARIGGLVADIEENKSPSHITLKDLTVSANLSATGATDVSGGLLGCHWFNTDVTFGGEVGETAAPKGVTISGATLTAPNAQFGGLVYQATGYWNATAANSIVFTKDDGEDVAVNTFTGKSNTKEPSGLLVGNGLCTIGNDVSALYLEVGTWGDATDAAYKIEKDAVTLTLNGNPATSASYFDELVGKTINTDKSDNAGNNNAVVSLATPDHAEIDKNGCNTYKGQIANYQNGKTRYYYNLDSFRENGNVSAAALTTPERVVSWSVSQYAASNIRGYFCAGNNAAGNNATITGPIDLTGYSYYPVTPLGTVTVGGDTATTLTFAYETMNAAESVEGNSNKPFNDNTHQHYQMHHGLLYNAHSGVTVSDTTFTGTVGQLSSNGGSGALIFGSVSGAQNAQNTKSKVKLDGVTLSHLCVVGASDADYAPLLINSIGADGYTELTVNNVTTSGYTAETKAATSLLGRVGAPSATHLTVTFSDIALDSRTSAGADYVWNNGEDNNHKVEYHTAKTIFTYATLLDSFQYSSDSSGTYNFNSGDTMVTYGVEISNSGNSGRNPGEQYRYYDNEDFAWDGTGIQPDENSIASFYTGGQYLRYVRHVEGEDGNHHELDINLRSAHLDEGCGTYGHPYEITGGKQLLALEKFLSTGKGNKWVVRVNSSVLNAQDGSVTHAADDDVYYMLDGSTWYNASKQGDKYIKGVEKNETGFDAQMYAYLRNAYYQIQNDISITSNTYMGIGGSITSGDNANAFSGVIVGKKREDGTYPTVYISSQISNAENFGGLIRYSQGSVVKDLTVSYEEGTVDGKTVGPASISLNNTAVPGSSYNPFFGGVVGYCMGGDTIIDNVTVTYGSGTVSLSGEKARLIAAGGYVGLVGGAKNSDGYEKTGGGVVFRGSLSNNFATVQTMASDSGDGATYFYCNPYVGRVLDGYACYDTDTTGTFSTDKLILNNTDKNYTIPNLYKPNSDLEVNSRFDVTVNSPQGLWLLSAIVNSGAGAMDSNGSYTDVNGTVDAYQVGKTRSRTADYDKIGTSITGAEKEAALADEVRWGGVAGTDGKDPSRVSYLVSGFTDKVDGTYYAAHMTGQGSNAATNNPVALTFSAQTIDMSSYKNGFRGIGGSYGQSNRIWGTEGKDKLTCVYRRTLYVNAVNGATSETTLELKMSQWDYWEEDNYSDTSNPGFFNQGAGLFTNFSYVAGCQVKNLTIRGEVKLHTYKADGTDFRAEKGKGDDFDICVGAFAARTKNASGALTFDGFNLSKIDVYGGTQTGGAIGCIEKSGGDKIVTFQNWSMNNATIETKLNNDGGAGGLIGWYYGGGKLTIDTGSVNVANVTTQSQGVNSNNAGGLVNGSNHEVEVNKVTFNGLSAGGTNLNAAGGIIGSVQAKITVNGCKFTGLSVQVTGSKSVGGLIGYTNSETMITGTSIECTADNLAKISNDAINDDRRTGGFVGFLDGADKKTTVENCSTDYLYVLSKSRTGGLFGQSARKTANIRNVKMSNTIVVSYGDGNNKRAGLLAGRVGANDKTIKGYNILADSCKVGYCSTPDVTVESLASANFTASNYVGRWVGELNGGAMNLVAVATKDGNLPNSAIGTNSGTASIVYADYPVEQTYNPTSSASPWLDVNPKSNVAFSDDSVMTGNGVGTGVARDILTEVTSTATNKKYCNLVDGETFSKFLSNSSDAYVSTYQAEEQGLTTVPKATDFPILVVNNTAENVDTKIWTYIAALTNIADAATAKTCAESVTAYAYTWTKAEGAVVGDDGTYAGSFEKQSDTASLTIQNDSKTFNAIQKNAYDNQQKRFTLLAVKYSNPTYNSKDANPGPQYFTLYVPVLVKKVLQATYTVRMLAGTDYYPGSYTSTSHAVADFNEPVTALIEYNYKRTKAEWQEALDNGENLLWYYEKTLNLIGSNSADGKSLPAGSRLTLVDVATGKSYTHEMKEGDDNKSFSCGVMVDTSDSEEKFEPLPICDRLNITESQTGTGKKYVKIEGDDTNQATVKSKDGAYYRLANDDEEGVYLHVGDDSVKDGKLAEPERYFLTIQVPESEDSGIINNMLESAMKRSPNAPPAELNKDTGNSGGRYVLYESIQQDQLTVKTEHLDKDGNADNDTEMNNNDAIRVTLSSTLILTDNGRNYYTQGYKPTGLNHQFIINLKKVVDDVTTDSILGATGISWEYKVGYKNENNEFVSLNSSRDSYPPGELDAFTLSSGKEIERNMVTWMDERSSLTIQAVITLQYGNNVGSVFPPRTDENDTTTGCFVQAESRVANLENQLSITGNKETAKDSSRYYCTVPTFASLSFDAIDYGGERTLQLGINCDDDYQPRIIQTSSVYDYSGVDSETLQKAKKVRYTLELFQKQTDNKYTGSALPLISSYVSVNGDNWNANTQGDKLIMEMDFTYDGGNTSISMPIELAPLTGPEFEKEGYTYANYMVRLTAVLLEGTTEGDYQPIESTKASDFVIYTNARVYQGIIPEPAS